MRADSRERDVRPITSEEFEEALSRAEVLLAQADRSRRGIGRYYAVVAGGWAAAAIGVGAVAAATGLVGGALSAAVIVAANVAFAWRVLQAAVAPLRAAVRRDERYAAETISLLREVLPFVSRAEGWSLFRVEETTLRIRRFPIRGGKP